MAHANFIESGETVTARPSIPITGEEVISEEIDLHSTLLTQTAIKGGKFQIINVRNAIERKGLISFRIVSGDNQFIDPYNTYVLITSSIKNPEGGNIPARAAGAHNPMCNVLPVNGLGTAWLKKIDVKLNGTTVSFDGNMYSHRADIENRLSYPDMVKKGHLSMPSGQSFEMTQEKPVSLILKLRRANNFVINVIVYSKYDSEIEMMNNRKVICHEYALKKACKN